MISVRQNIRSTHFMEAFHQILQSKAQYETFDAEAPLVLYGAGDLGRMAMDYCKHLGLNVAAVVDRNPEPQTHDNILPDIDLLLPEQVDPKLKNDALIAICVATCPYEPIKRQLLDEGWKNIIPFYDLAEAYRDKHPLGNGWYAPPFTDKDISRIHQVMSSWDDERSKAYYLQFLAWRRLREEWVFEDAPVIAQNRFFIPELLSVLHEKESFLDVGAHTGKVIERFLEILNFRFEHIVAIEPDELSFPELLKNIESFDPTVSSRIEALPIAVGEKTAMKGFYHGLGYASQFSDLSASVIPVHAIDDVYVTPSFIKIHIEGFELDALKGAFNTLQHYRPVLVVTSYHNSQGIWELPLWMMDNLPDYKFLMRLHSWCGTGAVIYAVPHERRP